MELRQLEHFVAVAEDESFTRAARRLGYVQSALSVSVQAIERELDLRLFDRTTHSVHLTDAGRQLLPSARATLEAAAEVRASAAAVNGVLSGRLAIGLMQSFAQVLDIPAQLGRFHREHPGVEILIRPAPGGSVELLRALAEGTLDIAYTAGANVPPGVSAEVIVREELMLCHLPGVGPEGEGPIPLSELTGLDFVDFPTGWGVRDAADAAFAELGLRRHVAIAVADVSTLRSLVEHGLGPALLPPSLIPLEATGLRHRATEPAISWEIVLASPGNRQPSAAARAFLAQTRPSG